MYEPYPALIKAFNLSVCPRCMELVSEIDISRYGYCLSCREYLDSFYPKGRRKDTNQLALF